MMALALPVLGACFVFGVVLPGAALCARLGLALLHTSAQRSGLHGYGALRYCLLVAPTALPLAWFVSACLHQAESGTNPSVCLSPDTPGVLCPEVACFAAALALSVALAALPRLIREQRALRSSYTGRARHARERLLRLGAEQPELEPIVARAIVVDGGCEPIATRGVFSPRVVIDAAFACELDDAALSGALRHESAHVRAYDPARYFLAWWAFAMNPAARWLLRAELSRWIVAREVHCDREAVLAGAAAPALAHALLAAARFAPGAGSSNAALRATDEQVLRLRVELLLAYSENPPACCHCRTPVLRFAACAWLLALAWPHHFGDAPLDALHRVTESAAAFVTGK